MRFPTASSPRALRATTAPPPSVAPQAETESIDGLGAPFTTRGARFWRTEATCSPAAGTPCPHTPTRADPLVSMTRLASPGWRGTRTWPLSSKPPAPVADSNPPLNAASRAGASSGPIELPLSAATTARPVGGSVLPTWSPKWVSWARNRKRVIVCPPEPVTVSVSTAMAPLTVASGVQPGCSVVVVVVGGTVVVVVDGEALTAAAPGAGVPPQAATARARPAASRDAAVRVRRMPGRSRPGARFLTSGQPRVGWRG